MEKEIQHEGAAIVYSVYGSGNPVMLVHGFGEKGEVWQGQVETLSGDYTVFVPQLPGCGGSGRIPDMSMGGLATALKTIITAEGIEHGQLSMFGHSMGGYITLAFAEQFPELLKSFGLIHSACFADSDEKKETRKKGIAFIRKNGAFAFLDTSAPNLFSPVTKDQRPELIKTFVESLHDQEDETLIAYYEAMMTRPDRSEVLKSSTLPVLFVLGKYDSAIPIKDGLRQTTFPELSYIHVLEYSGHMGMLEEKEKTNSFLREFLHST